MDAPERPETISIGQILVGAVLVLLSLAAIGGVALLSLVGRLQERPDKAHLLDLLGVWVPIIGAFAIGVMLIVAIVITKKSRASKSSL